MPLLSRSTNCPLPCPWPETGQNAPRLLNRDLPSSSRRAAGGPEQSGPRQWAPILPHIRTIYRWLEDNEEFRHQYTRARDTGHARADMAIHAAVEARDAGLGRLAYDALKWHASKLFPKYRFVGIPRSVGQRQAIRRDATAASDRASRSGNSASQVSGQALLTGDGLARTRANCAVSGPRTAKTRLEGAREG